MATEAMPKRSMPLLSPPSVLVDGRLATRTGAVWVPRTAPVFVVVVVGAVWTEATTPFGPKPGAHVIGPAGMTVVVVVVTVGVTVTVTGITLPVLPFRWCQWCRRSRAPLHCTRWCHRSSRR